MEACCSCRQEKVARVKEINCSATQEGRQNGMTEGARGKVEGQLLKEVVVGEGKGEGKGALETTM